MDFFNSPEYVELMESEGCTGVGAVFEIIRYLRLCEHTLGSLQGLASIARSCKKSVAYFTRIVQQYHLFTMIDNNRFYCECLAKSLNIPMSEINLAASTGQEDEATIAQQMNDDAVTPSSQPNDDALTPLSQPNEVGASLQRHANDDAIPALQVADNQYAYCESLVRDKTRQDKDKDKTTTKRKTKDKQQIPSSVIRKTVSPPPDASIASKQRDLHSPPPDLLKDLPQAILSSSVASIASGQTVLPSSPAVFHPSKQPDSPSGSLKDPRQTNLPTSDAFHPSTQPDKSPSDSLKDYPQTILPANDLNDAKAVDAPMPKKSAVVGPSSGQQPSAAVDLTGKECSAHPDSMSKVGVPVNKTGGSASSSTRSSPPDATTTEQDILRAMYNDEDYMRGLQLITGINVCSNARIRTHCLHWFRYLRHSHGKPITDLADAKQHLTYLLKPGRHTRDDFLRFRNNLLAREQIT